jgi:carbon-monoxide dehydrogenase medium subunit
VAVFVRADGRRVEKSSVVVIGAHSRPLRIGAAEQILNGNDYDAETRDAAAAVAEAGIEPTSDIHSSAETKRHLAGVLVRRALDEAISRANGVGGQQK